MITRYIIHYNRRIRQLGKVLAVLAIAGMAISPFLFSKDTKADDPDTFTVKAFKVVCETEADLPDWGIYEGEKPNSITATTAEDYVSQSEGACALAEGWSFEWGYYGEVTKKDGDFIGKAGGDWEDFDSLSGGSTPAEVQIPATSSKVWIREVLPEGYIPFNDAKNTTDPQESAEFYCDADILNYDNYDYIQDYSVGDTYYCIAFNAPEPEPDPVCGNGELEEGEECEVGFEACNPSYYTCSLETCECEAPACDPEEELIDNGGFEEPITSPDPWNIFTSDQVGWGIEWVTSVDPLYEETPYLELHGGVNNWEANTGDQYAELDSDWDGPEGTINNEEASVIISQDIPTVPGYTYKVSFAFSPRPEKGSEDNHLGFNWNGAQMGHYQATGSSGTVWTPHTYYLEAGDVTSTIEFKDLGTPNSFGTFLDSVSVTCYATGTPSECTDNDGDGYAIEGGDCGPIDCDDNNPDSWRVGAFYFDEDGDGYKAHDKPNYNEDDTVSICYGAEIPPNYTEEELPDDCDDTDADINPEAEEVCDNEKDDDCDGDVDCDDGDCVEDPFCYESGPESFCGDGNRDPGEECDGANKDNMPPLWDLEQGQGDRTYCSTDCELYHVTGTWCGDGEVQEGNEECDDGNNEDGDGCSSVCTIEETPECIDEDGDGYDGNCKPLDCDDSDPNINPGATEDCTNGKDDDCDGDIDSSDSDCEQEEDGGGGGGGGGGVAFLHLRIFNEENDIPETSSVLVTWFTNTSATSRVIYDTEPHSDLGDPPNYGYAFSTEEDSTKVTYHEMVVTGLTPGVTYYWRPVSHGSGEVVGRELAFQTDELPCRGEGESIPVIANPPECCEGLELIPPQSSDIVGSAGICTAFCGNGVCNTGTESPYNCPEDCEVITPPEEPVGPGEQEEEEETPPEEELPPAGEEESTTTPATTTPEESTPEETPPEDLAAASAPTGWLADLQSIVSGLFGGGTGSCVHWGLTALLVIISLGKAIQARKENPGQTRRLGIWAVILVFTAVLLKCMPIWLFLISIVITFILFYQKKDKKDLQ